MKDLRLLIVIVCCLVFQQLLNAQTSYTSVLSGNWSEPSVWSPPGVPGAADNVYIDQQTIVSTNGQREVAGFSILVGGELSLTGVDGSLTITGNGNWGAGIGGGIIRDVTSNNNGEVIIPSGAVLDVSGNSVAELLGGVRLLNQGTIRMLSSFGIRGTESSIVENQALFEIDTTVSFGGFVNGAIFINTSTGTFRKISSMGDCHFNANWKFQNLGGIIDVQSGSVTFNCDGIFSGGSYNADAGAVLHFDSQNHTFEGTLSGAPAGRIWISAGVTANTGVSGVTFDFQGTGLAWSGGTFTGSMITIPSNGLLVLDEFSFASVLSGGSTLLNLGTIRQDENLGIRALDLSIVDNQSLYEIVADNATFGGNPNGGIFINTGTLRNMGAGTCNFDANWEFRNLGGTIDVQTGTVSFNCDGIFNGGLYNVATGARLHFDSQNITFEGTLSGAPAGRIEMSSGVTANTGVSGATFDFQGTGLTWSGGTFMGATVTIPSNGLLQLTGLSSGELRGGTILLNLGTIRQVGNGNVNGRDSSIVDNQSLYEIVADNAGFGGVPNGGFFINTGTFRNMGNGTCSFNANWHFQNLAGGIIDAANGVIDIADFENAQNAIIQGIASVNVHTTFTNDGINAPGNSAGMLTFIGNYLPSTTGVLDIELGGLTPGNGHDQLAVTGNAVLNGTIDVSVTGSFIPAAGDSFVVLTTTGSVSDSFMTVNAQSGLYINVKINSNNVTVFVDSVGVLSVEEISDGEIVDNFNLQQNYPNPFNPSTNIQFALPQSSFVTLEVYNALGERLVVLVSQELSSGTYNYDWNASNLTSGVYFYRLQAADFVETKKMMLLK
jgi:hypothetical protein